MTTTASRPDETTRTARRSTLYTSVIGLAALAVLLQGLWAGLFIREGKDNDANWVEVHARGADVAIVLAVIATVVAVVKLRDRKDLVVGSVAFTVLLVVEAYLGGEIGDSPTLTAVHIPLAMALVALSVWLPFRASRRS